MSQNQPQPARTITEDEAAMLQSVQHRFRISSGELCAHAGVTPDAALRFCDNFPEYLYVRDIAPPDSSHRVLDITLIREKAKEAVALYMTQNGKLQLRDAERSLKEFDLSAKHEPLDDLNEIARSLRYAMAWAKREAANGNPDKAMEARIEAGYRQFFSARTAVEKAGKRNYFGYEITPHNAHMHELEDIYRIDGPEQNPMEKKGFRHLNSAITALEAMDVSSEDFAAEVEITRRYLQSLRRHINDNAGLPGIEASAGEIALAESLERWFAIIINPPSQPDARPSANRYDAPTI